MFVVQSKEFAEGISRVAKLLNITPHYDGIVTLQAVAKVVQTRLSAEAQANPNDIIVKVSLHLNCSNLFSFSFIIGYSISYSRYGSGF